MRLLVLSLPEHLGQEYRGIDRVSAPESYFVGNPQYASIEKISTEFEEYRKRFGEVEPSLEEVEDVEKFGWPTFVIRNVDEARWLVEAYRKYAGREFEIIEVVKGNAQPELGGEFLGYELAAGYDRSFLKGGLQDVDEPLDVPLVYSNVYSNNAYKKALHDSMWSLRAKYFGPKLNANGLFDDYEDAAFCLRCMWALPFVAPELYDQDETEKERADEVLALYKVS